MPWLGTSWKMTGSLAGARQWVETVTAQPLPADVDAFVLPPHTALATVAAAVPAGHGLRVGAQDAHWSDGPEWTGEVSVAQVADAGARIVEVGHSERRSGLGEGDDVVARKVWAVLEAGLTPLLCVGEPDEVRARGGASAFVGEQLAAALAGLAPDDVGRVLVAYEPVWSIGRGGRPARPDDVEPLVDAVRAAVADVSGRWPAAVLYGGSVGPDNAAELLRTGVDGLFVGRAAWRAEGFLALLDVVHRSVDRAATG